MMSTRSSKKSVLKLKAPSESDSYDSDDDDQVFDVAVISPSISTVTTDSYLDNCTTSTKGSSIKTQQIDAVEFIDDETEVEEPIIVQSVKMVIENLEIDVTSLEDLCESLVDKLIEMRAELKEKRKELRKWEKRVSTPTTTENAQLVVIVKEVNRQIHNELDGTLFYRTGTSKTLLRLSAQKVSTKSVREVGKPIVDGKKNVSVHVKDISVTLADMTLAGETELVEMASNL